MSRIENLKKDYIENRRLDVYSNSGYVRKIAHNNVMNIRKEAKSLVSEEDFIKYFMF